VHHEPLTSFALLAVVFLYSIFLGIVWFMNKSSHAAVSGLEAWVRNFCYV